MKTRLTYPIMFRVLRDIELYGHADLFDYLTAFDAAQAYLGEKIPGPLGVASNVQYTARLLAIGIAAHAMRDLVRSQR